MAQWEPRYIRDVDLPFCISRVPIRLRLCTVGSGDLIQPIEMSIEDRPRLVVGGLDSYRYAPDTEEAGYPVDKDNFLILQNRVGFPSKYATLGPFKRADDHHLPDIPKELYETKVL